MATQPKIYVDENGVEYEIEKPAATRSTPVYVDENGVEYEVEKPGYAPATFRGLEPDDRNILERSADAVSDSLRSADTGIYNTIAAGASMFGAGNPVAEFFEGRAKTSQSRISPRRQASMRRASEIMKAAEDGTVGEQVRAAGRAVLESPLTAIGQGVGSVVPFAAATALGGAPAALLAGAGVGAGSVKSGISDAVKASAIEDGMTEAQAERFAEIAQSYAGKNKDNIALGAFLGAVAARLGVEKNVANLVGKKAAERVGALAAVKTVGKGAVAEGGTEAVQEGQQTLAQNVALRREGKDVPLMRGVAGTAAQGAILGGVLGATAGGVEAAARQSQKTPEQIAEEAKAPAYMPAKPAGIRYTKDEAIREINELTSSWKNAPTYEVVDSVDDIGDLDVRAEAQAQPAGSVLGVYGKDGVVRIVAGAISDPETLRSVTFHESLGHYGLAQKFREGLDKVLTDIDRTSPEVREAANALQTQMEKAGGDVPDRAVIVEEVLAGMSEDGPIAASTVDKLKNFLKQVARRIGMRNVDYSVREIRTILSIAHQAVIDGRANQGNSQGGTRFIKLWHGTPADEFAGVDAENPYGQFLDEFMNTGEGAQAYTWGHYTAQQTRIAEGRYREGLSKEKGKRGELLVNGQDFDTWIEENQPTVSVGNNVAEPFFTEGDKLGYRRLFESSNLREALDQKIALLEDVLEQEKKRFNEITEDNSLDAWLAEETLAIAQAELDWVKEINPDMVKQKKPGSLFEVEAPDPKYDLVTGELINEDGALYLNYDGPVSPEVAAAFEKLGVPSEVPLPDESMDVYNQLQEKKASLEKLINSIRTKYKDEINRLLSIERADEASVRDRLEFVENELDLYEDKNDPDDAHEVSQLESERDGLREELKEIRDTIKDIENGGEIFRDKVQEFVSKQESAALFDLQDWIETYKTYFNRHPEGEGALRYAIDEQGALFTRLEEERKNPDLSGEDFHELSEQFYEAAIRYNDLVYELGNLEKTSAPRTGEELYEKLAEKLEEEGPHRQEEKLVEEMRAITQNPGNYYDEAGHLMTPEGIRVTAALGPLRKELGEIRRIISSLDERPNYQKAASKALLAEGVLGTYFLDGDSRNGAENPTFNFVFYGPKTPKIVGKFAKKGLVNSINLDKLRATGGVKKAIRDAAMELTPRGVETHKDTVERARLAEMLPEDFLKIRPGLSEVEVTGGRMIVLNQAEKVHELSLKIRANQATEQERSEFLETVVTLNEVVAHMSEIASTLGRSLNALGIVLGKARKGGYDLKYMLDAARIPNLSDEKQLQALAERIAATNSPEGAARAVADTFKPLPEDYLTNIRYSMMLSGIGTPMKALVGTTTNMLMNSADLIVAAGIGALRGDQDRVTMKELSARAAGFLYALSDYQTYRQTIEAYKQGTPTIGEVDRLELQEQQVQLPYSMVTEYPRRTLAAVDTFLRAFLNASETYGLAARQAFREGLTGDEFTNRVNSLVTPPTEEQLKKMKPTERALRKAIEKSVQKQGDIQLLLDNSSRLITGLNVMKTRTEDMSGMDRVVRFAIQNALPFVRNAVNIATQFARYTPGLNLFTETFKQGWEAGGAERDRAVAKVMVGSAVLGMAATLALNGLLTGEPPEDFDLREQQQALGVQPRSVLVNGEWRSYDGLDAIGLPFNTVATITDRWKTGDLTDEGYVSAFMDVLGQTFSLTAEAAFMEQLGSFAALFSDKPQDESAKINYQAGFASSFVPAIVRQATQYGVDPQVRITSGDNSAEDRILGRVKSGLPFGMSESLPQKYDVFGRPVSRDTDPASAILAIGRTRPVETDPVILEVARLAEAGTGEGRLLIKSPPNRAKINGENRRLTAEEQSALQKRSGEYVLSDLREAMADPVWATLSDEDRRAEIQLIVKQAHKDAKLDTFPPR